MNFACHKVRNIVDIPEGVIIINYEIIEIINHEYIKGYIIGPLNHEIILSKKNHEIIEILVH
jgi:hypothetical protein